MYQQVEVCCLKDGYYQWNDCFLEDWGLDLPAVEYMVDLLAVDYVVDPPTVEYVVDLPAVEYVVDLPAVKYVVDPPAVEYVVDPPAVEYVVDLPAVEYVVDLLAVEYMVDFQAVPHRVHCLAALSTALDLPGVNHPYQARKRYLCGCKTTWEKTNPRRIPLPVPIAIGFEEKMADSGEVRPMGPRMRQACSNWSHPRQSLDWDSSVHRKTRSVE